MSVSGLLMMIGASVNAGFDANGLVRRGRIDAFLECRSSRVSRYEKHDRDNLGSARLQRAGFGVSPKRTSSERSLLG